MDIINRFPAIIASLQNSDKTDEEQLDALQAKVENRKPLQDHLHTVTRSMLKSSATLPFLSPFITGFYCQLSYTW
jgi:hypothetical protein